MPLIHCPECDHEISDTAKSCPNCGFVLKQEEQIPVAEKSSFASKNYFAPEGTKITRRHSEKYTRVSIVLFAVSVFGLLISTSAGAVGFIALFFCLGITSLALVVSSASRDYVCPYCGSNVVIVRKNAVICGSCRKSSAIVGDMLKPIE